MKDNTVTIEAMPIEWGVSCRICESFVPMGGSPSQAYPTICKECRKRLKELLYKEGEI